MSVILIVMIVPDIDNSIKAINSGSFLNKYVLKAIFYSYTFGVFTGYIIYMLLRRISNIRKKHLFLIQLAVSSIAAFAMIHYTMGLMSV